MSIEIACSNYVVIIKPCEVKLESVMVDIEESQGVVVVAVIIDIKYGDVEVVVLEMDGGDVIASDSS